jgi:hypothetical protein
MDFDLTGDQQRLVEQTRDYAERVIRPASGRLDQLDGAEDFPFDGRPGAKPPDSVPAAPVPAPQPT